MLNHKDRAIQMVIDAHWSALESTAKAGDYEYFQRPPWADLVTRYTQIALKAIIGTEPPIFY